MSFETKEDFGKHLLGLTVTGLGVEVGAWDGRFAERILSDWTGKVVMVDTWPAGIPKWRSTRDPKTVAEEIKAGLGDRTDLVQLSSELAAEGFKEGDLDFVHIDTAHDYDSVTRDLTAWVPKVRSGGIVAGSMYLDDLTFWAEPVEVKRAVDDFLTTLPGVVLQLVPDSNGQSSAPFWWFVKP